MTPEQPAELIQRPGLRLRLWRRWLQERGHDTSMLRAELIATSAWEQPTLTLYGRSHPVPRLTSWMADPGCSYRYSGIDHHPAPFSGAADHLRQELHQALGGPRFNSLLLNLYRHGHDRMGWHADDEPELDPAAPIASLSLGASRDLRFRIRPGGAPEPPLTLPLEDGDLLLMEAPSQRHWQHGLPTRTRVQRPRLNLTYRVIRPEAIRPQAR
ncbi:MAG: alpha-ketoglutarate-dependent dioxygenase AlkB family protein [Cyanobacteriota bacterium]